MRLSIRMGWVVTSEWATAAIQVQMMNGMATLEAFERKDDGEKDSHGGGESSSSAGDG